MDKDFEYWYQKVGFDFDDCLFHFEYSILKSHNKMMFQVVSYADAVLFKWVKTYLIAFFSDVALPYCF
jgi:hypothetical protein